METQGMEQLGLAALVAGAIQIAKPFLPKRFLPMISWGIGAGLGAAYGQFVEHGNLVGGAINGSIAGMAANGLYEQTVRARKKKPDSNE